MKKTIMTIVACVAVVCAQAQTINPLDSVDAQVKEATLAGHNTVVEKSLSHYLDVEGSYVGNNLDEMVGSSRVVFGAALGFYVEGQYQDGQFYPEAGIRGEYHGKKAGVGINVGLRQNRYTKYQDKDANESFLGVNFQGDIWYAVWQNKNHHSKLSIGAWAAFTLTGQKHGFEAHEDNFDFEYQNDFKARIFSGGGEFRWDYAPGFQSGIRHCVKLKTGISQAYEYNNHHEYQFTVSLSYALTFNLHKTKHGTMSAKTGRMISQY
jgi:hypothetical protein